MIDDATLAGWEQDMEQALRPSSLQQGAMWAGLMVSHLRAAIAEIRRLREERKLFPDWKKDAEYFRSECDRLRKEKSDLAAHLEDTVDPECRRLLDGALTNLAAHQAVVGELARAIEQARDSAVRILYATTLEDAKAWADEPIRGRLNTALAHPLVVAARKEPNDVREQGEGFPHD